jgi:polyphosphate kinase
MYKQDYINRELSWLDFNYRVLNESLNDNNPLMEKINFLSISSSNLDEFFMVRVGKLSRKIDAGRTKPDPSGMTPAAQLAVSLDKAKKLVKDQYGIYRDIILPQLKENGIQQLNKEDIDKVQKKYLRKQFRRQIVPVLTPRVLSSKYPFPLLAAKRLFIAALLKHSSGDSFIGLVPVPSGIKRLVHLPTTDGTEKFILLEDVVKMFIEELFPNAELKASLVFRVTRNTDFLMDIRSADSIIEEMERTIKRRTTGRLVRLEIEKGADAKLKELIISLLGIRREYIIEIDGAIDLRYMSREVRKLPGFNELRYEDFSPKTQDRLKSNESIFDIIKQGDVLMHHPYDDYSSVVRFVKEAVEDPNVLAIKQTLYRVAGAKPFIAALAHAAQKGKQVTVLVEVRARFDEENNINWCRALEKASCNVIYGSPKWKTHSKITLVVRQEGEKLMQYMHLGTGNYNDATARGYTDISLLSCDKQLARDAQEFFSILSGFADTFPMNELVESPYSLRGLCTKNIRREKENALKGGKGLIVAKMNSICDPKLIKELYAAADAGAYVYLMIRGVCSLNVPAHGRVIVRSIVGRFLEHARIFVFYNEGLKNTYISSADWMPRNLDKRLELTIPIKDTKIAERLHNILALEFMDNAQAWHMQSGGEYIKLRPNGEKISCQEEFMKDTPREASFDEVFLEGKE